MHAYIARQVYYVGVHLFFASLVWSAASVLTRLVRGSATAKYWEWVATPLDFAIRSPPTSSRNTSTMCQPILTLSS